MDTLFFVLSTLLVTASVQSKGVPASRSTRNLVGSSFSARLSHYDATNTDTFNLHYLHTDLSSVGNDSILVVVGEGALDEEAIGGINVEIADELNSAIFYLEHRFYGNSVPTTDTSVENLRWLTIDQTLGDIAQFIEHIKTDLQDGRFRSANVTVSGCGFGGSLATWMRVTYPHVAKVAFAEHAVLEAREDFSEHLDLISAQLLSRGGQSCLDEVTTAMQLLSDVLQTSGAAQTINGLFSICSMSSTSDLDQAAFFHSAIVETLSTLLTQHPEDVSGFCQEISGTSGTALSRLASWVSAQNYARCDANYQQLVQNYGNTNFNSNYLEARLRTFKSCSSVGLARSTSSSGHPFLHLVPVGYFQQMCLDVFSSAITPAFTSSGVERTNLFFGGSGSVPDRVVSVVSSTNPWSPLGLSTSVSRAAAPVLQLDGTGQCYLSTNPSSNDNTAASQVRRNVIDFIRNSLRDVPIPETESSASQVQAMSFIFLVLAGFMMV